MSSDYNLTDDFIFEIAKQWHTSKNKGDLVFQQLFQLSYYITDDVLIFFNSYIQMPLLCTYVIAFAFVIYIFIKEDMLAFINVLLVLSNILEIVPLLLMSPITMIFFLFAKRDVPLPSPWCNILIMTNDSIYHILHTISINLKIILALNRICGVYFPLKFKIWFSKTRCVIYTFVALAIGGCIGLVLNLTSRTIKEHVHLDDVWGDGYLEPYKACFTESSYVDLENANPILIVTRIIQVAVNIFFIIILIICDIFLVVKLRQQQREREAIQTRSATTKATENRINLLNRVCMWVLLVMIISALPKAILRCYSLYVIVNLGMLGADGYDTDERGHAMIEVVTIIMTTILTPLDLFVFFGLSNKAKSRLRKICCVCTL